MAGQTLTITKTISTDAAWEKLQEGLQDLDPFWDAVEMHMIDSVTQNFESAGRPTKWEPLSEWTIAAKGSSAILQDSGALKGSINSGNTERSENSLDIWAGEVHGLFHQYVDMDPMAQFGIINKNKRYPMPMRPFMMFQDEDIDTIEEILGNFVDDLIE
jgi:phage gpG-like protein